LSEEDLISLTDMKHSLPDGDVIPYHEFVNRRILDMTKTESILELLDVDVESTDDQNRGRLFSFSNREKSAVSQLIDNAMTSPSSQVSS